MKRKPVRFFVSSVLAAVLLLTVSISAFAEGLPFSAHSKLTIDEASLEALRESGSSAYDMVALAVDEWKAGNVEIKDWRGGTDQIKYNEWFYGCPVHNVDTNKNGAYDYGDGQFYPWCAVFISWLADKCGLIDEGLFPMTAGCYTERYYFESHGFEKWKISECTAYGGEHTVFPGDILIWGGDEHIGLVVAVNENSIETVEGNSGNAVDHNEYFLKDIQKGGYLYGSVLFRIPYPDNESRILTALVDDLGLSEGGAVGVLANMYCESGLDPNVWGDNGTSYGLCQWHAGRCSALQDYCERNELDADTVSGQLAYLKHELEVTYPSLLNSLQNCENSEEGAYEAAYLWCQKYEVPEGWEDVESERRAGIARDDLWETYFE